MEPFLIRILIAVAVIWVTQVVLDTVGVQEPAKKLIFLVVVIVAILYALFNATYIHL